MKKLISFIAVLAMTNAVFGQTQLERPVTLERTVTINVTGNRIKQIAVDGKSYAINNLTIGEEQAVMINGLLNGQHSLELFRTNRTTSSQTSFTLREGYDLTLSISANGSVSMSETRTNSRGDDQAAISATAFNKIFIATKNRTSSTSRSTYLESQFTNSNKRFTSKQASQLIQLVNSESFRHKLAKAVYAKITDRNNFSLVSSLLKSNSNKQDLNEYIANFESESDDPDDDDPINANVPMTSEKFNEIYREVLAESTLDDRKYYLSNFFAKDVNYYTSSQVKQLIQLINSEGERYNLAKQAYHGITDRENYGQVINLLNLAANKTALRNYIASYDNTNAKVAMSTTDFSRLYQSVYANNSTTARYNALNTSFSTTGYYFTATQARQLIQLVNNEAFRLALSKSAYRVLVDRVNYTQLTDLLTTQSSRNELNAYVMNYDNNSNGNAVAMGDAEFNTLYTNINNAWSSSSRMSLATEAFNSTLNYFSTSQVRRILMLANTDVDRLTLAKLGYDNVVDQANYSQVYDVFQSADRRNELARYISDVQNGGTGTTVKIAMSDNEFQSMLRDVKFTFGLGAKMSVLTNIFNKETNYFSVQQARELIQLVSAESNRLELAKSAYNNVADPANFTQLYDIFTSQSSKDELSAYISNASNNN